MVRLYVGCRKPAFMVKIKVGPATVTSVTAVTTTITPIAVIGLLVCHFTAHSAAENTTATNTTPPNLNPAVDPPTAKFKFSEAWLAYWASERFASGKDTSMKQKIQKVATATEF